MRALALILAITTSITTAKAETVAIVGGTVHTVAQSQPIEGGTVVIQNGRITAVGRGVAVPSGARVIDAKGKHVTPGIFNAFTQMGLLDVGAVQESNDAGAEKAEFSAAFDVEQAINPQSTAFAISRIDGITRAVVSPTAAKTLFGGKGALIHLGNGYDPVFKARAFQYVELGETGGERSGGSRAAAFVSFVNALREAQQYNANRARYIAGAEREALTNRLDTEALIPVVTGQMPALIHVERAPDIVQVIRLKQQFPALRIIIAGAAEGWMVADKLAAANIPVVTSVLNNLPVEFETLGATMNNVGRLTAKGVTVALGTIRRDTAQQARWVLQEAGNAVGQGRLPGGQGLSWEDALKSITLNPARIYGVDKDLGSLEVGKIGDVVVWDNDPLDLMSAPANVLIAGSEVPLVSRQTKLRDRYRSLESSALPMQYKR